MNPGLPNSQRRRALTAALKKVGSEERMSLEQLAMVWGTAKSRFVNVKNEMLREGFDFPPAEPGPKNSNLYHASVALAVMLDYETRKDKSARDKDAIIKKILGQNADKDSSVISIPELAILNREGARAEERAREQGLVTPLADQAAVAGRVFSTMADFFGDIEARVDPNGQLPPEVRAKLRELAEREQVKLYNEIKEVLSDDPRPANQKRRAATKRAR